MLPSSSGQYWTRWASHLLEMAPLSPGLPWQSALLAPLCLPYSKWQWPSSHCGAHSSPLPSRSPWATFLLKCSKCKCCRLNVCVPSNSFIEILTPSLMVWDGWAFERCLDHGIWPHDFMAKRWGNSGNSDRFYLGGAPKSLQMVTAAMKLKDACSLEEKLWPT